ncbi:MAG: anaerobic ribonucleoside-triphosphate reductase activating protein [Bdellovibrionaceae bacterium]|nr:anaerobic ribonucleoside-triphosphate reductase activating protein [Pseudobdellovibrionaceae bacterium]
MKYLSKQIVFREVPDEISLSYLISGCSLRCLGCHSADAWNPEAGAELSYEQLVQDLKKNEGWITCVLFMGGEWQQSKLVAYLDIVRNIGLKTALYTGQDHVHNDLRIRLDYLKTGPYKKELGGLSSLTTNQKIINVKTGELLNSHFFVHKEVTHDSAQ